MAKVLILCPTFDHADTLHVSIASVRAQHFRDWEMVVIGDGAPDRSAEIIEAIRAEDARISAVWQPKSERFGELYRDPIIRASTAEFVLHLSDDDVWLPEHIDLMLELLEHAEWVNQAPLRVAVSGEDAEWWPVNHGTPSMRAACQRRAPLSAGINYVGYRREAYLRLPEGWTCAPWSAGTSDVYMWSKFFHDPALVVASAASTSAIKFPSTVGSRKGRSPTQRMAEIAPWLARCAEAGLSERLRRAGSVGARMVQLMSVHRAGNTDTLNQAFASCGLLPAAPDARPQVAVNGEPMLLPLSERQREEAAQAWRFLRVAEGVERAPDTIDAMLGTDPNEWLYKAQILAMFQSGDSVLRVLAPFLQRFPDRPAALSLQLETLAKSGQLDAARQRLDEIKRELPGYQPTARLNQMLGSQ
ncbi:glycosyltransferase family 2 protein [Pseudomarimonas arenosa]|uniref:Glycosyltransferase n=1 Tax=Pseudomarimonas arenosa TaxID=2774145 RepID=A0AAW3ZEA9_9GAMM|nr:glycosyltransferase family 2 protein [Pseudomarimonas arenosa]MBD8524478.1 glycosyltransferase [Pseudomarimonas arenosa]